MFGWKELFLNICLLIIDSVKFVYEIYLFNSYLSFVFVVGVEKVGGFFV